MTEVTRYYHVGSDAKYRDRFDRIDWNASEGSTKKEDTHKATPMDTPFVAPKDSPANYIINAGGERYVHESTTGNQKLIRKLKDMIVTLQVDAVCERCTQVNRDCEECRPDTEDLYMDDLEYELREL